jgi:molecular chaperone GrpE (heat shock protein)
MTITTAQLGDMIGRAVAREMRRTRPVRKSTPPTPAQLSAQVAQLQQRAKIAELEARAMSATDPVSKAQASAELTRERLTQAHRQGRI